MTTMRKRARKAARRTLASAYCAKTPLTEIHSEIESLIVWRVATRTNYGTVSLS